MCDNSKIDFVLSKLSFCVKNVICCFYDDIYFGVTYMIFLQYSRQNAAGTAGGSGNYQPAVRVFFAYRVDVFYKAVKKRRVNEELWLAGIYTAEALASTVGNMFPKGSKYQYPSEPKPITVDEAREREEREQKAKMEQIKARFTAKALGLNKTALVVMDNDDVNVIRAAANLPKLATLPVEQLSTYEVVVSAKVVMTKAAVEKFQEVNG